MLKKILIGVILLYVLVVVGFESMLGYSQPENQGTLVITTYDNGEANDRVVTRIMWMMNFTWRSITGPDSGTGVCWMSPSLMSVMVKLMVVSRQRRSRERTLTVSIRPDHWAWSLEF